MGGCLVAEQWFQAGCPIDRQSRTCSLAVVVQVLYFIARSIMKLQSLYGLIPSIKGKGKCAQMVADMVCKLRRENFMVRRALMRPPCTLLPAPGAPSLSMPDN